MANTVLTSWALLVWQSLQEQGINPRPLFKRANLDPGLLGDGNARYDQDKIFALWQLVEETSGKPDVGLNIGRHWTPTTFHALGFAFLAADFLLEGMERLARYARLVNNSFNMEVAPDGPYFGLRFYPESEKQFSHPLANDAAHAALLTMCRLLMGEGFHPIEVQMIRPAANFRPRLESEFGCPCQFDCEANYWLIDRFEAERKLPSGNAGLGRLNETLALDYLNQIDHDDIVRRTRQIIMEQLPGGQLDEEAAAEALQTSTANLRQELAQAKCSFSGLLQEARKELARSYIRNSQLSLSEVSYLLGFTKPSSFTRAFRRWFGLSPSDYRRQLQESGAPTDKREAG